MNKTTVSRRTSTEIRAGDFRRFYTMVSLFVLCTILYYFGEIIDFFGWETLRWEFFYSVHDIHRMMFLAPIIYAGYFFGVRAAAVVTIIAVGTILPRALFVSPFPDPLLRTLLFIIIAGVIGYLTGSESERRGRLRALVKYQRDTMLAILGEMAEGVLITGPDYRIRFMNPSMIKDFGEGVGTLCYQHLHRNDAPCRQICKLPDVTRGAVERWEHNFPDGSTYQVVALPYIDSDGTSCQLSILWKINQRAKEAGL
jgi:hypothetical protein